MPTAVGSVAVVAAVPVKTTVWSVLVILVVVVNVRKLVDIDPCTSSMELGVVVPMPTCAVNDRLQTPWMASSLQSLFIFKYFKVTTVG